MSKEFPDIAFVNVDGQAVPFTKPQHYKKGSTTDTLLTGEDNPLPTKDEGAVNELKSIKSEIVNKQYPNEMDVTVKNQIDSVKVSNLQQVQDVNVLNPVASVNVNNLPTDYPDQAVEARLQAIEQTQSQILDKLNDTIDTRLTGSIVEIGAINEYTTISPNST